MGALNDTLRGKSAGSNYLHYGDALECQELALLDGRRGLVSKAQLVQEIATSGANGSCLAGVVQSYGSPRSRIVDLDRLRRDLRNSVALRARFQALGCRGFSYKFCRVSALWGPVSHGLLPLRGRITLRFALIPDEKLFYPPRVRAYLRRFERSHFFHNGHPAIAFALGAEIGGAWYVFTLQSDVAFKTPSYVREHFRGWRKVLFAEILRAGVDKARAVYLCTAADALRACHREYHAPRRVPHSWEVIYEQTAADFRMKLTQLESGVNIQVFHGQPVVYTRRFYEYLFTGGGAPCFETRSSFTFPTSISDLETTATKRASG
jgi:hypothetical protein